MIRLLGAFLFTLSIAACQPGFPFTDERLNYAVSWPSGLGIGEGSMQARKSGTGWSFEFALRAGIPGFEVQDAYHSAASADLCSVEFQKNSLHGRRKSRERTVFDAQNGIATCIKVGATSWFISGAGLT